MKAAAPLILAAFVAAFVSAGGPVEAQARYDADAESAARRAELEALSARMAAQQAEAARLQAETRARLRALEELNAGALPVRTVSARPSAAFEAQQATTAARVSSDAQMRQLDAELARMDAWLDQTRKKP